MINSALKDKIFRFWCQKVLPAVYDDSLSYYELLNKVIWYINHIIEDNKEMVDLIENFFDNIDVEAEVDRVVTQWMEDHPEFIVPDDSVDTVNLVDKAVTNAKLSDDVNDSYYDNVTFKTYRKYGTTIYIGYIPYLDADDNKIDPYILYRPNTTPNQIAVAEKTDLTVNGASSIFYTDNTQAVPNIYSRGENIYAGNISGTIHCNDAGYLNLSADREWSTYPITLTKEQLDQFNPYNLTDYYYKLIVNNVPTDLTTITNNEGEIDNGTLAPRLALGIREDKTLVILACDGRTPTERGLTPLEEQNELVSEGCVNAVQFDGGGSTSFNYRSTKINRNVDGGGTVDRAVRFTFNIRKPDVNRFISPAYTWASQVKQQLRTELYNYINSYAGYAGYQYSADYLKYIPENADLNTFALAPGRYVANPDTLVATLEHCPTQNSFTLSVTYVFGTGFFHELRDYQGNVYYRTDYFYSNEHHLPEHWQKVVTETVE